MPAQALTMQECSAKYNAAQTAGTLNGQKWNDFRKAECGTDAAATPAAAPAAPTAAAAKPQSQSRPAAPAPGGRCGFSRCGGPEICQGDRLQGSDTHLLDQWKANKASNANGGLQWVQKGGGYWSECNKKLKGSA